MAFLRSRENQAIVELALRQQLAVYVRRHPRPRLSPLDRAFWVTLSRFWPQWRSALVLLREYIECYTSERVHTSIADSPDGRSVETRPSDLARVIGLPRVGGLHHRYTWAAAA